MGLIPTALNKRQLPPATDPQFNSVKFATLDINATNATINLSGLNDASSRYHGLMIYHRRRNMNTAAIQGNAGANVHLSGAIYAKWANLKLSGGGRFDAQFVVGSMSFQANRR